MRNRMEWLVAGPERMTDEMVHLRLRLYSDPEIHESMLNVFMIGKNPVWTFKWEEEDLEKFEPETLVFWTEHNPGQGPDYGEYVARLIPGAKFYNMLDAAHWPQWEKPEEHDQVLIDFIKGQAR
jgi:2-hydroxy-6-oxonona-2,4-dienedioate hydrolase/2-hydroxy-6-oxo-6-(2'-carboxyphenyl)-hexa-2,4-dienoate hydrolase